MPESAPIRRIAHLDMDAFYASVELLRYPQLRGLPLVIGAGHGLLEARLAHLRRVQPDRHWDDTDRAHIPLEWFPRLSDYAGRGVITTASYEAREFGVGSAMGLMKAARHCPQAILLPTDFVQYRRYSRAFKQIIRAHAPVMENRGIDEVYVDFTHAPGGQVDGGRALAARIQQAIFQATALSCSVGVAPNKLMAKMASEFNKPHGISVVWESDLQEKIWPLPCRKVHGIGPKTDARLARFGIETIGQLAARERHWLMHHFGRRHGAWLHDAAWGRDDRPVVTESEPVSISRETTFARDLHAVRDRTELGAIFTELAQQVADDLARDGYAARTIGVKLRYSDFQIVTREQTIDDAVQDAHSIRTVAGRCLKRADLSRPLRLLGVRTASLVPADEADPAHAGPGGVPTTIPLFE